MQLEISAHTVPIYLPSLEHVVSVGWTVVSPAVCQSARRSGRIIACSPHECADSMYRPIESRAAHRVLARQRADISGELLMTMVAN